MNEESSESNIEEYSEFVLGEKEKKKQEKQKYTEKIANINTPEKILERAKAETKVETPIEVSPNSLIVDGKEVEVVDTNDVLVKLRTFMEGLKNNDRIEIVAKITKETSTTITTEPETFLSDEEREIMRERIKFDMKKFTIYPRAIKGQYILFDLVNRYAKMNGEYGYIDKDDLMSDYVMSYWNFIHWLKSDVEWYSQYGVGKQKGRKGQFEIQYFNRKGLPMPRYMLHPAPIGKGRLDTVEYESKFAELVERENKKTFTEEDLNIISRNLRGNF